VLRLTSGLLAASMVIACGASEPRGRGAAGPAGWQSDWLDGDDEIEAEHLERVFALGQGDPQARALFDEAKRRLGGGSVEGLVARMDTCATDGASEPGHAKLYCEHALLGLELEDVAAGRPTATTQQRIASLAGAPARDARVEMHADYVLVERTLLPQICVVPRMTVAEAYEVLVHELVHALRYQPCQLMAAARSPLGDDAFRVQAVLAPGGEAEAYTVSVGARLRLRTPGTVSAPLLDLFDRNTGALQVAPEVLAPRILGAPPTGLGYAQNRLKDPRGEAVSALVQQLSLRRALLVELVQRRRAAADIHGKNVAVHTHNIDGARQNVSIAERRGDRRARDEWRAKLAASEQGLVNTRAMIAVAAASDARISAELATLDAELAQLTAGGRGSPAAPPGG
jgi:hypothetical protein